MPAITIELDDETLDRLRAEAGTAVAWDREVMLTVMHRLCEALSVQGQEDPGRSGDSLSAAVRRGDVDERTAAIIRGQIRDYRSVFDRLAE